MGMLMFEHFCDRPTWAAAAGYEFNIINCLSYSAVTVDMSDIKDLLCSGSVIQDTSKSC